MAEACEVTLLMPCLNEAETLASCVNKARGFLIRTGIDGEVLIADNGSTDDSLAIAVGNGARVICVSERGYGATLIAGIRAARGKYIIMGDSDDSYDFGKLDPFVEKLREGYELVVGNRFHGGIARGAMPALHRYLGNPVLTAIGRLFFGSPCGDFHCGLRGVNRQSILRLQLQARGMEFASEMIVKATVSQLKIVEVPTTLSPAGRSRRPHLRSWRDGWRHLRFLLLSSPRWLFLYPGLTLFLLGLTGTGLLLPHPRLLGGIGFDIHSLLYAAVAVVIGFQSMEFWVFARILGVREGVAPRDPWLQSIVRIATVEKGLVVGALLLLAGLGLGGYALSSWNAQGFGALPVEETMRLVIPSATAILLAFAVTYGAFFISLLNIAAAIPEPVGVALLHAADEENLEVRSSSADE